MAGEGSYDPVEILQQQQEDRKDRDAQWVAPILSAAEAKGGVGVAVTKVEQKLMVIKGIEAARRRIPGAVKLIQASDTVEGDYYSSTDQLEASLRQHDAEYGSDGIIIVEGIDALGTLDRMGGGNPHVNAFLTELAYWRRSTAPSEPARTAVVGLGLISLGQEAHVSGNTVSRPDMGTSFVDIFDQHFIITKDDGIQNLQLKAVDPRTAGLSLSNTLRGRNMQTSPDQFPTPKDVADSQGGPRLPE